MLLSIILPFFNPMPFFIRMIESLILEAKPFCDISLVEIIFINDGSTDHAVSFIKKYESYKNIHIFSIINSGVSNARNVGLNLCNGEYVWFVDADDLIPHMSIDVIIRKLQSLTKPTDIIFANFFAFDGKNDFKNALFRSNYNFNHLAMYRENDDIFDIVFYKSKIGFTIWNQLFRVKYLRTNQLQFDTEICISEDFMFKVESLYYVSSIDYINYEIYGYRIPNGRSTLSQRFPTVIDLEPLLNKQIKWYRVFDKCYNHKNGSHYMKLLFSEALNNWIKYLKTFKADETLEYVNRKEREIADILKYLPNGASALFHKGI